jgi:hypothetical protein
MRSSGYTFSIWETLQINILRVTNVWGTLEETGVAQNEAEGAVGDG